MMDLLEALLLTLGALLITLYIFRSHIKQSTPLGQRSGLDMLGEDLRSGGPGLVGGVGRVEGKVEVHVRGNSSGAVGVCLCEALNVMYWWRAVGKNGHSLLLAGSSEKGDDSVGSGIDVGDIIARGAVAAIRLWGSMWEKADSVDIFLPVIENEKAKRKLIEQVEDCQNKYGVRMGIVFESRDGGAQALADQLLSGRGAGQADEGWHNMNLRIVDQIVHQLVDHTGRLSKHYFDL